jgi:hypothetical protein
MDVVRALFVCGVITGLLFVLVFLIEGAMTLITTRCVIPSAR